MLFSAATKLYISSIDIYAMFSLFAGSADHEDMCLENSFCLNGGTCYYLKTIGAKFCKYVLQVFCQISKFLKFLGEKLKSKKILCGDLYSEIKFKSS